MQYEENKIRAFPVSFKRGLLSFLFCGVYICMIRFHFESRVFFDFSLFYPIVQSYALLILGLFPTLSKTGGLFASYAWTFSCFIHNPCHIRNLYLDISLFYPKLLVYSILMLELFPVFPKVTSYTELFLPFF